MLPACSTSFYDTVSVSVLLAGTIVLELFVGHDRSCSMLTGCGAPVGREEVGARVTLLRVGLAQP
jgi:hypothetical protein